MDITLIYNDRAGSHTEVSRATLIGALQRAGHTVRDTAGGDVVIAAGGDGTVIAAALELVGTQTPLIALPFGTANNVAHSLGTSTDPDALIDLLAHRNVRQLDMGVAHGSWGQHRFVEGAGVGLFCDALDAQHLSSDDKEPPLAAQRLVEVLMTYEPRTFAAALDGVDISGSYLLLDIMNVASFGPNLSLSPTSDPFDGLFDVVLVRERHRRPLLAYLAALGEGERPPPPRLDIHRGKHLRLRLGDSCLRIDDAFQSQGGDRSPFADIRIVPAAIPVWLPRP